MHKYIYIYIYTYTHTYTYIYIFYKGRLCVWHEPKKARPSKFRAIRKQIQLHSPHPSPTNPMQDILYIYIYILLSI